MLNVKKLLTKILVWLSKYTVQQTTYTGTSNSNGAIDVRSVIRPNDIILSVSTSSDPNAVCIPWKYNNANWFVKVVRWENWASYANTSITMVIKYITP